MKCSYQSHVVNILFCCYIITTVLSSVFGFCCFCGDVNEFCLLKSVQLSYISICIAALVLVFVSCCFLGLYDLYFPCFCLCCLTGLGFKSFFLYFCNHMETVKYFRIVILHYLFHFFYTERTIPPCRF